MIKQLLKQITRIVIILVFISLGQVKAENVTINFSTNFDDNYAVYIIMNENGMYDLSQAEPISIDNSGSVSWSGEQNFGDWIQVVFTAKKRDRQIGASFPLVISKQTENISFTYSDSDYVTIQESDISNLNRVLVEYSSFKNKMLRNRFLAADKNSGISFNSEDFLTQADKLIQENQVNEKSVIDFVKINAYNNYLETTLFDKDNLNPKFPEDLLQIMDNETLISIYNGVGNLDNYLNYMLEIDRNGRITADNLERKFKLVDEYINTEALADRLIQSNLSRFTSSYKIVVMDDYLADAGKFKTIVMRFLDDEKLQTKYIENFDKLLYTTVGGDMPDVKFKDLNGNEVSLESFKGKYIYIDFWASWCGPCLVEIPHLKNLEETYKNKNIEFVSISVDLDKKAWRKKVDDQNMKGNQWEAGDSNIEKVLNITGVPHFVIYDTEGKLMHYNAPRPSSAQIRELFDKF